MFCKNYTGVVVTTNAIVFACSSFVCFQLSIEIIGKRSSIKHLLFAQHVDVVGSSLLNFGIGTAFDINVSNQFGTTQLRQDLFSQYFEYAGHVLDLLIALNWIISHSQNLKNQIFVFDIRSGNQFFEAFPVLTVSCDVVFSVNAFQSFADSFLTAFTTSFRKFVVEFHRTIRRSITFSVYATKGCAIFVRILFNEIFEHLHLFFGQLALTYVRTVDQIHDVGALRDRGHSLEVVGHDRQISRIVGQSLYGAYTLSNRNSCEIAVLFAFFAFGTFCLDTQFESRKFCTFVIGERYGLSVRATGFVRNNRIVVFHFFALQVFGSADDFATFEYQYRGYLQCGFLVEVFSREGHRNISNDVTSFQGQHCRRCRDAHLIDLFQHLLVAVTASQQNYH